MGDFRKGEKTEAAANSKKKKSQKSWGKTD